MSDFECVLRYKALVQPVCTVYVDEVLRTVAADERAKESNQKVESLLKVFSKHGVEVLVDLGKEILQNHGCTPSLRGVFLSVSRNGFVKAGYNLCLKNCVEKMKISSVIDSSYEVRFIV